jgi:hypothetical protein
MFWRKRKPPLEVRRQASIRFLGEQDGNPERQLKAALIEAFGKFPRLERAYLARVAYGESEAFEVALCIRGSEDRALVKAVGSRFSEIFAGAEHLDIFFLSEQQESELQGVCRPFFTSNQVHGVH